MSIVVTLNDIFDQGLADSFADSSISKECACTAGDLGLIPGLGRSPGEGIDYPLQYSWASPVAQLTKKSACNAEELDLIPGLGRSAGEGKGSNILAWRIPWTI